MTLLNRTNLEVSQVASKNPYDRALNGIRVEPDGSTVASNGRVLLAVGPAERNRASFPPSACDEVEPPSRGLLLPLEFIGKVLKAIPIRTKRPQIQYCALSKVKDPNRVGLTSVDERGDATTNVGTPKQEPFPDWRSIIRKVRGKREKSYRICLNRKDLIEVLKTLESVSPSKGDTPLFMEINEEGAILRSYSQATGQRTVGAISAMRAKWPSLDLWEEDVFGEAKVRVKKAVKRKK